MRLLTQEKLKSWLYYDPDTGECVYLKGRYAGYVTTGYRATIDGVRYKISILAVLYMTGEFPQHEVDHLDGDIFNNSWKNLRDVPHILNQRNMHHKTAPLSGVTGVGWCESGESWRVTIGGVHIGNYKDLNEAITVRRHAEEQCEYYPKTEVSAQRIAGESHASRGAEGGIQVVPEAGTGQDRSGVEGIRHTTEQRDGGCPPGHCPPARGDY